MSNNRMLALVAILAGGLMVGACGESVTGLGGSDGRSNLRDPYVAPVEDTDFVGEGVLHDPKGSNHVEAYDEDIER
jgi:hypothetical protein